MTDCKSPLCQPASHDDDDVFNANAESPSDATPGTVTEKSPGPLLTDLPDKCLASILKYIPFQNMDDIIEFSPHWNKLVQEHIPVEIHLTDIGFRIAMHYFIGHADLPKYRVQVIHSRVLEEPLPGLKSPEDVLVLNFATHTEVATYKQLAAHAVNLRELYFGYSSLTSCVLSEVEVSLPKLAVLHLADRAVEYKTMNPNQQSILPQNIVGFLSKTLPSIKKLVVVTAASRKQTVGYVKELLRFIQRHSETLKILKFTVATSIVTSSNEDRMSDLVEFSTVEENIVLNQLAKVKLAEVDINFGWDFFCGLEQWRWALQHQSELSYLTFGMEKPLNPSIYELPITLSASSLKSVQIGIEVFDPTSSGAAVEERRFPLDCSIFADCVNLQMLVLQGPVITADTVNEGRTPTRELLNIDKLPQGLHALAVENIYLESRQIAELTQGVIPKEKQRSLQKLSFNNIGTCSGFGVPLSLLDCWINAQSLQEIMIKTGINSDESRLYENEHLFKIGVKSPIAKCSVHAYFYPTLMEYRTPAEGDEKKVPAFTFE